MSVKLLLPLDNSVVDTHNESQKKFIAAERFSWTHEKGEIDYNPLPIVFEWNTDSEKSTLEISETDDFSDSLKIETDAHRYEVYNLKNGTDYYWRVNDSEIQSFHTKEGIRIMHIDGLNNVRDIGGYMTCDGKRVKQGLFYRGEAFNDYRQKYLLNIKISSDGLRTALFDMKIKTELELRNRGEIPDEFKGLLSAYGADVKRYPIENYYLFVDYEPSRQLIKAMFDEVLSKPEAYPVYAHCMGGADRTGTLCATLLALLGVSKEEILCDYEITLMGAYLQWRNDNRENIIRFRQRVLELPGVSLRDKAIYYLTEMCGISRVA